MTSSLPRSAVLALLGEALCSRLGFGLVSLALPLYARQLGLSLIEVGLLVSFGAVASMVARPLVGGLAERYGLRRTLLAGMALRSAVTLLFALCWLPWQLFGLRGLQGLAQGVRRPAVEAWLAHAGGKKAAASVFARYVTARTLAAAIGRAAAGLLLAVTAGQFGPVFALAFLLSALPLLVVWLCVKEPQRSAAPAAQPTPAARPQAGEAAPRRPGLLPIASLGALMSVTADMLRGLFPILATEYAGLTPAQTGMIYLAASLVTLGAGPLFRWLAGHLNRERVRLLHSAANVLSSALYLASPTFLGVATARVTDDMGKAAFRPARGALGDSATSDAPATQYGPMAILGVGANVGELLAPILAGILLTSGGLLALMVTRIALAACTEVYAVYITRRLQAAEDAPARAGPPTGTPVQPLPIQVRPAAPGNAGD